MTSRRYDINTNIQDAINQILIDIKQLNNSESERTHYRADKAESIARFARALETIALHQHNLTLDPTMKSTYASCAPDTLLKSVTGLPLSK